MAHGRAKNSGGQTLSSVERVWRERLEAWRRSGLRQAAYCRRQGLSPSSLSWWKGKIARQDRQSPPVSPPTEWLAVRTLPLPSLAEGCGQYPEAQLEVVLRCGRCVRVGPGFDASALERLVRVLESLPC